MKKRNGMCPFCYAKSLAEAKKAKNGNVPVLYNTQPYGNDMAKTPPMGWSSWNTFQEKINQDVVEQTAVEMKRLGLVDAGYVYLNIDDCWGPKSATSKASWRRTTPLFPSGWRAWRRKSTNRG